MAKVAKVARLGVRRLAQLGEEVTRIRTGLGMTQDKFGDLVGAHYMTVSRWERGVAQPTPYVLAVIQVFGEVVGKGASSASVVKAAYEAQGAMKALYRAMQLVYVS